MAAHAVTPRKPLVRARYLDSMGFLSPVIETRRQRAKRIEPYAHSQLAGDGEQNDASAGNKLEITLKISPAAPATTPKRKTTKVASLLAPLEKSNVLLSPDDNNDKLESRYSISSPFASGKHAIVYLAQPVPASTLTTVSTAPVASSSAPADSDAVPVASSTAGQPGYAVPVPVPVPVAAAQRRPNGGVVVKSTPLRCPKDENEPGIREVRILQLFSVLSSKSKTFNYIHIEDWYKTRQGIQSAGKPIVSVAYMHEVLEFANIGTLRELRCCTWREWQSVAFQSLYALYVGQRELQFAHLDLHGGNILLASLPKGVDCMGYRLPDGTKFYTSTFVVKISDFGLSCVRLPDSGKLLSSKDRGFDAVADLESLGSILKSLRMAADSPPPPTFKSMRRSFLHQIQRSLPQQRSGHIEQLMRHSIFDDLREKPVGKSVLLARA